MLVTILSTNFKAHLHPCGQLVVTSLVVSLRPSTVKSPRQAA